MTNTRAGITGVGMSRRGLTGTVVIDSVSLLLVLLMIGLVGGLNRHCNDIVSTISVTTGFTICLACLRRNEGLEEANFLRRIRPEHIGRVIGRFDDLVRGNNSLRVLKDTRPSCLVKVSCT